MESFLILKCLLSAAHTMSLMTLDVPGMHLSMSVVHSTNVSLLRGSGGAVSARATIRQPMTVKAEAPTNSPSGKCTLLENTAMTPPVSWRTSSSFYGKSASPRRSFKTSQRRQRRDYHLPGAQCWLQSSGVIDRHCFPFHYSRLEAKWAWGAIRSYTRGCLALLGYRRPVRRRMDHRAFIVAVLLRMRLVAATRHHRPRARVPVLQAAGRSRQKHPR
jgi:hypothetical protein